MNSHSTNSVLIVRANSIVLPTTTTTNAGAGRKSLSKLLSTTVDRAKHELSTRASTLTRKSTRNDRRKRLSWNETTNLHDNINHTTYYDQAHNSSQTAQAAAVAVVGLDKMDAPINNRATAIDGNNGRRDDDASDRSTSTKSSQLTNASSSSSSAAASAASAANRTGAKKKAVPMMKPTTILSLADRDLVIIDGNDIKESVQNESEVIVVDHPPRATTTTTSESAEVDLMDILGSHWPALAGDTAQVLNAADRRASGGQVMKPNLGELQPTRNKSMNIMSHLKQQHSKGSSSTLPRSAGASGTHGHGQHQHSASVGGSTNSSFESSHSGSNASERRLKSEYRKMAEMGICFQVKNFQHAHYDRDSGGDFNYFHRVGGHFLIRLSLHF